MTIVRIKARSVIINLPEKANPERRKNAVTGLDHAPFQGQENGKVGTSEPAKIEGAGNDRNHHQHLLHQLLMLIKS